MRLLPELSHQPIGQRRGDLNRGTGGADARLQRQGVHNINFVTPTHYLPQILAALWLAIPQGFSLPIVWNSSGYEKVDALRLLDGVVDIYLPDMKYARGTFLRSSSRRPPAIVTSTARRSARCCARSGICSWMMMALPAWPDHPAPGFAGGKAGSRETLGWIAENLGTETHIALMNQYFPAHRAVSSEVLDRKIVDEEYDEAVAALEEFGLENGWVQE